MRNSPFLGKRYIYHESTRLPFIILYDLLLDEERLQVSQLVDTGADQHNQLDDRPLHHPGVGQLRLVAEGGLADAQVFLFVVDLGQLLVERLDTRGQVVDLLRPLGVDKVVRRPLRQVKVHLVALVVGAVNVFRGDTDQVFPQVLGGESELTGRRQLLVQHPVVIVKSFVDGDLDLQVAVVAVVVGAVNALGGLNAANKQGVGLELLVEAPGLAGVQVEVERQGQMDKHKRQQPVHGG